MSDMSLDELRDEISRLERLSGFVDAVEVEGEISTIE